jgi:hypothetical protein
MSVEDSAAAEDGWSDEALDHLEQAAAIAGREHRRRRYLALFEDANSEGQFWANGSEDPLT